MLRKHIQHTSLIIGLAIMVAVVVVPLAVSAQDVLDQDTCVIESGDKYIKMGTRIPGLTQTMQVGSDTVYAVKDFRCFAAGLYRYLAGAAGILSAVMMMYGGVRYVFSFGNQQKFSEAQDTIVSAMVGLALTLGSYIILFTINPALVRFEQLNIPVVPRHEQGQLGWEGHIWCQNSAEFAEQPAWTCGQTREKDGVTCTAIGLPQNQTSLCIASLSTGRPVVAPVQTLSLEITYNGQQYFDEYRGNREYDCGTIVFYEPGVVERLTFGGRLRDIGTRCTDPKQACLIFKDDKFTIFQQGDLAPSGEDIIGTFINAQCI